MYCLRICLCILLAAFVSIAAAQSSVKRYSVKNGKMYIELGREISRRDLNSFMAEYNLYDLPLEQLVRTKVTDSMVKLGWKVENMNKNVFILSKPLFPVKDIDKPQQKIIFAQKQIGADLIYPENMEKIVYGYNRFKNKSFVANGATVTFFLRSNSRARQVRLAGTFTNWESGALPMKKTDSGWIALVKLDPGKHWYKFIIDGDWDIDNDNSLRENDGRGNVNSVFYKTNFIFKLDGYQNVRRMYLAGSFNNWRRNELMMLKTASGWQLPFYLAEGTHTYKFIADGEWITDPKNEKRLPDGSSGYNSVVEIGKPYMFKLSGYTNAKLVALTGSFNNWRRDELYMSRTGAGWQLPYVLGSGNYEYRFLVDGKPINDPANPAIAGDPQRANSFLVIDPNYTFRLKGFNNATSVFLTGDFNNWNPYTLPMKRQGDAWVVNVNLFPGKHLYKFIADGKWIIDPGNKLWEQNEYGTGNSVLWIDR